MNQSQRVWRKLQGANQSVVVGIDLAGVYSRETGFCVMCEAWGARTQILHTDDEIIAATLESSPRLVCIDAPLGLPKGRCCLRDDCKCRSAGHLRECDRELQRRGIRFFPVTLGPMRKLTARGIFLRKKFENMGFQVIESYPGGIQDILGIPRKQQGIEPLRAGLKSLGVRGDIDKDGITDDELDAVTAAVLGRFHIEGGTVEIGDPDEVLMVLPRR